MQEIERRFLVTDLTVALASSEDNRPDPEQSYRIEQAYLFANDEIAMRVRMTSDGRDARGKLTVKVLDPQNPMVRQEYDHQVPLALVERQIAQCPHRIIKQRQTVWRRERSERWEIDVFEGDNAGLVIAELELRDVEQSLVIPPWAGIEVTDDPRYSNAMLARHPFNSWKPEGVKDGMG